MNDTLWLLLSYPLKMPFLVLSLADSISQYQSCEMSVYDWTTEPSLLRCFLGPPTESNSLPAACPLRARGIGDSFPSSCRVDSWWEERWAVEKFCARRRQAAESEPGWNLLLLWNLSSLRSLFSFFFLLFPSFSFFLSKLFVHPTAVPFIESPWICSRGHYCQVLTWLSKA